MLSSTRKFAFTLLGEDILRESEKVLDFKKIIETEVIISNKNFDFKLNFKFLHKLKIKSNTPMLLCSITGYDASGKIEDYANENGKQLTSIAIGSAEGFEAAEKAINTASRSGTWVLLKNVHLAPSWSTQLEKKIHGLKSHSSFKLFLSMDIMPKV